MVRNVAMLAVLILTGCGSAPAPRDPTQASAYRQNVRDVVSMNRQANDLFRAGKGDDAAAIIEKSQPVVKQLLSVSKPSLEAVEAASDLDDLYGRMLLSNRHYAWAQMLFQKNLSRWKHWEPQTEETARRFKQAQDEIAECSRRMEQ
jgi:hypothetical protein